MFGLGILKGLGLTLKHMWETYWDDLRWWGRRYFRAEGIARRRSKETRGIFTVQYPEEKLPPPEAFRVMPFLIYEEQADGGRKLRCTACGICAKVCPPQCIWITRSADPATGKPIPAPAGFYVEIDLCMNCGFCAEYCPFDAIKMDHEYELASEDRKDHIYNLERLGKSVSYYASIRPAEYKTEQAEQGTQPAKRKLNKR